MLHIEKTHTISTYIYTNCMWAKKIANSVYTNFDLKRINHASLPATLLWGVHCVPGSVSHSKQGHDDSPDQEQFVKSLWMGRCSQGPTPELGLRLGLVCKWLMLRPLLSLNNGRMTRRGCRKGGLGGSQRQVSWHPSPHTVSGCQDVECESKWVCWEIVAKFRYPWRAWSGATTLTHRQELAEVAWASVHDVSWQPPSMSKRKDSLGLSLSVSLGMLWDSPGGAGGDLGISAQIDQLN